MTAFPEPPSWVNQAGENTDTFTLTQDQGSSLLAWLQASWAGDEPPEHSDIEVMTNYRRHTTGELTATGFRSVALFWTVALLTFALLVLVIRLAYR